uniref:HV80H14.15A n=1 Tax=Hordeum vulgare TaxID=4513 RepID=Q8LLB3_HORVU|nr:HV80H14.15A [Hordeum vulgare subsp. vulgare]
MPYEGEEPLVHNIQARQHPSTAPHIAPCCRSTDREGRRRHPADLDGTEEEKEGEVQPHLGEGRRETHGDEATTRKRNDLLLPNRRRGEVLPRGKEGRKEGDGERWRRRPRGGEGNPRRDGMDANTF